MKRLLISIAILFTAVSTAYAASLSLAEVTAPDINCLFDTDCTITPADFTADILLPGSFAGGFVQSRVLPVGEPGTAGEGVFTYQYRIDMRNSDGTIPLYCVSSLSFEFGPVVMLDYDEDGDLDQAYVITAGGIGTIAPLNIDRSGNTITLNFDPAVCAGPATDPGESSFFVGLASPYPPRDVTATIGMSFKPSDLFPPPDDQTLTVRAPAFPSGPSLAVVPGSGRPDRLVTLVGHGYLPGGYQGTIRWDGGEVTTFTIPDGGSFSIPVNIPGGATAGDYTITVCAGSPCFTGDFEQIASTLFTVSQTDQVYLPIIMRGEGTEPAPTSTPTITPVPSATPTATVTITPTMPPATPAPPAVGESLRIGTYNAQMFIELIPELSDEGSYCDEIDNRTGKLAQRIIENGYDIIALSEVGSTFDKLLLEASLLPHYPHYIRCVGSGTCAAPLPVSNDSGLMLFSRFPFEDLPRSTHQLSPTLFMAQSGGADWPEVAGIFFGSDCAGADCWINKGAVYVRVRNPNSGRIYNVVFTHLQADKENQAIRQNQIAKIQQLIEGTLIPEQIKQEDIFILGDLNINGDHQAERNEWDTQFGDPSLALDGLSVFSDTWEFETHADGVFIASRDRGLTTWNSKPAERLDYIVRNRIDQPDEEQLCFQHLNLAYNLRFSDRAKGEPFIDVAMGQAGIHDLSDHYGLNADINWGAPHCRSRDARIIETDEFGNLLHGQITHPGSMQWFRIDEPGTYAIALPDYLGGDAVDYQVYASTDMTVPLESHHGERTVFTDNTGQSHEGVKYVLSEGPYYVRVFAPDRARTGPYALIVHKNLGCMPDDALTLLPNWPGEKINTDVFVAGCSDTRWFALDTEAPFSGRAQELRFSVVDSAGVPNSYFLELLDDDTTTLLATSSNALITRTEAVNNWRKLYLTVRPEAGDPAFQAVWHTDLTVLHGPMALENEEQTEVDALGNDDDDIRLTVLINGLRHTRDVRVRNEDEGDFDVGHVEHGVETKVGPIRFLPDEEVFIQLHEDDTGDPFAGCNDILLSDPIEPLDSLDERNPGRPQPVRIDIPFVHEEGLCGGEPSDSGLYFFHVFTSHGRTP